MVKTPNKKVR